MHLFHLVELREHGHRAGGRVNTALGFGRRNALHTVSARLKLQFRIGAVSDHADDHFLIAAKITLALRDNFRFPALTLGIAHIHAEQVARKKRRFIAARAGTDFQEDVPLVVRISRQQHDLEILIELLKLLAALRELRLGEFLHVGIRQELLALRALLLILFVLAHLLHHGLDFGAFTREIAELIHIAAHFGGRQHRVDFLEPSAERAQLGAH